jgi:hypothetical protein
MRGFVEDHGLVVVFGLLSGLVGPFRGFAWLRGIESTGVFVGDRHEASPGSCS